MDVIERSELSIKYLPITALSSNPHNSRTHSKRQIRQIADSIRAFGFTNPVLVDQSTKIVAGHGRVAAAKLLGIPEVPTILIENLSSEELRAYVIADNRLAEKAGWDRSTLAIELQNLLTNCRDLDVTITGFEIPEIDMILSTTEDKSDPDDNFEVPQFTESFTQPGDLWQLGRHRILCGSALELDSFSTLLGEKRAEVVFVDPPYNVAIDGNVSGKGSVRHREFAMASGEMSEPEFISFLTSSLSLLAQFSVSGSVHYVCMDWRHMSEVLTAGREAYDSLLNLCIWTKNNGGMGSFYRSQHELVFVFRNHKTRHRNNVQLGRFGRNRTNVWNYSGTNSLSKVCEEGDLLALHPTVKPVGLIADALLDCSARGDLVLDAFLGSGSTLIAAERTGRCCHGIELDPAYVDVAVKRWQRYTGDRAVHSISGIQFGDVVAKETEQS
jgi:DNA modification methylase